MTINILSLLCSATIINGIRELLKLPKDWETYIYETDRTKDANRVLFNYDWAIILVGKFNQETKQLCIQLRNSEEFSAIPILGIEQDLQLEDLSGIVDGLYSPEDPISRGVIKIRSLIRTSLMIKNAQEKAAAVQEKSIFHFLLLENIKKYISKKTLEEVKKCALLQKLNIHEKEERLTVVFTDICKFTTMAETLSPKETIHIMNKVFSLIIPSIHKAGGDIDKFIGDAFFAVFETAHRGIQAIVEIFAQMNKKKYFPNQDLYLHAAIHTGPVIRGNVGGDGRFDHTLIGDTVNITSRLLSLARKNEILISKTSLEEANITMPDLLRSVTYLPGKETPTTYYSAFPYLAEKYSFNPQTRSDISKKPADNLDDTA